MACLSPHPGPASGSCWFRGCWVEAAASGRTGHLVALCPGSLWARVCSGPGKVQAELPEQLAPCHILVAVGVDSVAGRVQEVLVYG